MGVGICLSAQLVQTKNKECKSAIILQRYHPYRPSTEEIHSFSLSLQAQNLPFQQILPTVDFFYLLDCLTITGLDRTYYTHHFIFSFTF